MLPLERLLDALPGWATVERSNTEEILVDVAPLSHGGIPLGSYALRIYCADNKVKVAEVAVGAQLPAYCPERHVNPDGSFCLGLGAGDIESADEATKWWEQLQEFLRCQAIARSRGEWPPGRELAHGDAALYQLKMEEIAKEHGWLHEVQDAHAHKEGWLAGELPRERKHSGMLVNQRAACPRGCLKKGYPILRRDCPHRDVIFRLVQLERDKRVYERDFLGALKKTGKVCCGTMKNCPLKENTHDQSV